MAGSHASPSFSFSSSSSSSSSHPTGFHFARPSFSHFPIHQNNSRRFFNTSFPSSSSCPSEKEIISLFNSFLPSPADFLSSYISSMESTMASHSVDESRWKYDVFVSFRGEDTRNSFASHLFQALGQEGYTCFRDNDKQTRGMVIESKLLDAIRHSMVALVLFSANYADSRWCLNELVEILECQKRWKEDGHLVLPIFYDVEPGEVRKQSGKFGEAFERCKKAMNWDAVQIDKWKGALQEAGNLSGWHLRNDSNGDEANFISNIVSQLTSMKLPAERRRKLAETQAEIKKTNAIREGLTQIDAMDAATPKRNMIEQIQALQKKQLAYAQLVGLTNNNPDFVDMLSTESSKQKGSDGIQVEPSSKRQPKLTQSKDEKVYEEFHEFCQKFAEAYKKKFSDDASGSKITHVNVTFPSFGKSKLKPDVGKCVGGSSRANLDEGSNLSQLMEEDLD